MNGKAAAEGVASAIARRMTCKVLGDPAAPIAYRAEVLAANDAIVREAIETAGWAPFHYDRGVDGIAEPWRVHWLRNGACRELAKALPERIANLKPSNKMPGMLSACGSLVLVSWLPQFRSSNRGEGGGADELSEKKKQRIDDEHLCATAALIQNLLVILTAHDLGTYWSSGGLLEASVLADLTGIRPEERLAGAIFVDYRDGEGPILERIPGKLRSHRSKPERWIDEREEPRFG